LTDLSVPPFMILNAPVLLSFKLFEC
jgi:hypothetical protein